MNRQSVIPSGSVDALTFAAYHAGENRALLELLQAMARGQHPGAVVFIWGAEGTGKTHLLQATAGAADAEGRPFLFIDCESTDAARVDSATIATLPENVLVCLDNLGQGTGNTEQELLWLSLYERIRQGNGHLVVAASKPPPELALKTPDLVSRLSAGGVYRLVPLGDDSIRRVLAERSQARGFEIPEKVMEYIMRHHARDTRSLFQLLDRIDRASLSQHRRITIPFLRELLTDPG